MGRPARDVVNLAGPCEVCWRHGGYLRLLQVVCCAEDYIHTTATIFRTFGLEKFYFFVIERNDQIKTIIGLIIVGMLLNLMAQHTFKISLVKK